MYERTEFTYGLEAGLKEHREGLSLVSRAGALGATREGQIGVLGMGRSPTQQLQN